MRHLWIVLKWMCFAGLKKKKNLHKVARCRRTTAKGLPSAQLPKVRGPSIPAEILLRIPNYHSRRSSLMQEGPQGKHTITFLTTHVLGVILHCWLVQFLATKTPKFSERWGRKLREPHAGIPLAKYPTQRLSLKNNCWSRKQSQEKHFHMLGKKCRGWHIHGDRP